MNKFSLPSKVVVRSASARIVFSKTCACGAEFSIYYVEVTEDHDGSVRYVLVGILVEDGQRFIEIESCSPWHNFNNDSLYNVLARLKAIHEQPGVVNGGGI